jgi:hypothetical protein
LGSVDLHDIVQLIGGLQHSGRLELRKNGSQAVLGFDQGRLVSADAGQVHGLAALAVCTLELESAHFTFVGGVVQAERSLGLGPSELRGLLLGMTNGHLTTPTIDHQAAGAPEQGAMASVCRNLGFADDASRHYSRPTALHRATARTSKPTRTCSRRATWVSSASGVATATIGSTWCRGRARTRSARAARPTT